MGLHAASSSHCFVHAVFPFVLAFCFVHLNLVESSLVSGWSPAANFSSTGTPLLLMVHPSVLYESVEPVSRSPLLLHVSVSSISYSFSSDSAAGVELRGSVDVCVRATPSYQTTLGADGGDDDGSIGIVLDIQVRPVLLLFFNGTGDEPNARWRVAVDINVYGSPQCSGSAVSGRNVSSPLPMPRVKGARLQVLLHDATLSQNASLRSDDVEDSSDPYGGDVASPSSPGSIRSRQLQCFVSAREIRNMDVDASVKCSDLSNLFHARANTSHAGDGSLFSAVVANILVARQPRCPIQPPWQVSVTVVNSSLNMSLTSDFSTERGSGGSAADSNSNAEEATDDEHEEMLKSRPVLAVAGNVALLVGPGDAASLNVASSNLTLTYRPVKVGLLMAPNRTTINNVLLSSIVIDFCATLNESLWRNATTSAKGDNSTAPVLQGASVAFMNHSIAVIRMQLEPGRENSTTSDLQHGGPSPSTLSVDATVISIFPPAACSRESKQNHYFATRALVEHAVIVLEVVSLRRDDSKNAGGVEEEEEEGWAEQGVQQGVVAQLMLLSLKTSSAAHHRNSSGGCCSNTSSQLFVTRSLSVEHSDVSFLADEHINPSVPILSFLTSSTSRQYSSEDTLLATVSEALQTNTVEVLCSTLLISTLVAADSVVPCFHNDTAPSGDQAKDVLSMMIPMAFGGTIYVDSSDITLQGQPGSLVWLRSASRAETHNGSDCLCSNATDGSFTFYASQDTNGSVPSTAAPASDETCVSPLVQLMMNLTIVSSVVRLRPSHGSHGSGSAQPATIGDNALISFSGEPGCASSSSSSFMPQATIFPALVVRLRGPAWLSVALSNAVFVGPSNLRIAQAGENATNGHVGLLRSPPVLHLVAVGLDDGEEEPQAIATTVASTALRLPSPSSSSSEAFKAATAASATFFLNTSRQRVQLKPFTSSREGSLAVSATGASGTRFRAAFGEIAVVASSSINSSAEDDEPFETKEFRILSLLADEGGRRCRVVATPSQSPSITASRLDLRCPQVRIAGDPVVLSANDIRTGNITIRLLLTRTGDGYSWVPVRELEKSVLLGISMGRVDLFLSFEVASSLDGRANYTQCRDTNNNTNDDDDTHSGAVVDCVALLVQPLPGFFTHVPAALDVMVLNSAVSPACTTSSGHIFLMSLNVIPDSPDLSPAIGAIGRVFAAMAVLSAACVAVAAVLSHAAACAALLLYLPLATLAVLTRSASQCHSGDPGSFRTLHEMHQSSGAQFLQQFLISPLYLFCAQNGDRDLPDVSLPLTVNGAILIGSIFFCCVLELAASLLQAGIELKSAPAALPQILFKLRNAVVRAQLPARRFSFAVTTLWLPAAAALTVELWHRLLPLTSRRLQPLQVAALVTGSGSILLTAAIFLIAAKTISGCKGENDVCFVLYGSVGASSARRFFQPLGFWHHATVRLRRFGMLLLPLRDFAGFGHAAVWCVGPFAVAAIVSATVARSGDGKHCSEKFGAASAQLCLFGLLMFFAQPYSCRAAGCLAAIAAVVLGALSAIVAVSSSSWPHKDAGVNSRMQIALVFVVGVYLLVSFLQLVLLCYNLALDRYKLKAQRTRYALDVFDAAGSPVLVYEERQWDLFSVPAAEQPFTLMLMECDGDERSPTPLQGADEAREMETIQTEGRERVDGLESDSSSSLESSNGALGDGAATALPAGARRYPLL
jgi:hypothetical protein